MTIGGVCLSAAALVAASQLEGPLVPLLIVASLFINGAALLNALRSWNRVDNDATNENALALVAIVDKLVGDAACIKARTMLSHGVDVCELLRALDKHADPQPADHVDVHHTLGTFLAWLAMFDAVFVGVVPAPMKTCWRLLNPWRDGASLLDAIVLTFVWRRARWSCPAEADVVAQWALHASDDDQARLAPWLARVQQLARAEHSVAAAALLAALGDVVAAPDAEALALDDGVHPLALKATNAMIAYVRDGSDSAAIS